MTESIRRGFLKCMAWANLSATDEAAGSQMFARRALQLYL
jgi:hypothetical protein